MEDEKLKEGITVIPEVPVAVPTAPALPIPKTSMEIITNIEAIIIYSGDPTIYEFKIVGRILHLSSEELLTPKKFKTLWLDNFHELLSFSYNEWALFIKMILGRKDKITIREKEENSPARVVAEKIITAINKSVPVSNIEDSVEQGKVWYNEKTSEIFVNNETILGIIDNAKFNGTEQMKQLRIELRNYLSNTSQARKINKESHRFWRFKSEKLDLDLSKLYILDKGEEEEPDGKEKGKENNGGIDGNYD